MGITWQTPDQKVFIEKHIPLYVRHVDDGTVKAMFWPDFLKKWFETWPVVEPTPHLVEKEGNIQKALKLSRSNKIGQLKHVIKAAANDNTTGGRRNLRLESSQPRKPTEVHVYMKLYYDSRIWPVVVERWADANLPNMDFSRSEIPEEEVDPEDSALMKDTKVPLCFKNSVAQELYDAEEDEIKEKVQSMREAQPLITNVYDASEEDRVELVRDYQRNISLMGKNLTNVLRNLEHKYAAKGIIWMACPLPLAAGRPVGHFKCARKTPNGQDFEAFIGAEKAVELKLLFTSWVQTVYPVSEWPLFTYETPTASTSTQTTENEMANNLIDAMFPLYESSIMLAPEPSVLPLELEPFAPSFLMPTHALESPTLPLGQELFTPSLAPWSTLASESFAPPLGPELSILPFTLESTLTPESSILSLGPEPPTPSFTLEPIAPLNQSGAMPCSPGFSDLGPPHTQSDDAPAQPILTSNQLSAQLPAVTTVSVLPGANTGHSAFFPDTMHPSSRLINQPWVVSASLLPLGHKETPNTTSILPSNLLAGITNEPMWMKKKKTLNYFHTTFKLGEFSNVIAHWYELEGLLGFQDTTPAGFPITKRPLIICSFYKHAHNYQRDYNVEAGTLSRQIIGWWLEICPPDEAPSIQFGGPTGIYTLIVLMSWWCTSLKGKPDADCLRTLVDIDRVLLTMINGIKNHPTASALLSSTSLPPPQPCKRMNAEEMAPRKRKQTGLA